MPKIYRATHAQKGGSMSKIRHDLAGWIETDVIAEHILEELEDQGAQPTLENAKAVWLDVLETELCYAIRSSIKAKFDVV